MKTKEELEDERDKLMIQLANLGSKFNHNSLKQSESIVRLSEEINKINDELKERGLLKYHEHSN
jgi:hypothetical protein